MKKKLEMMMKNKKARAITPEESRIRSIKMILWAFLFICIAFIVVIGRMFVVQIVDGKEYAEKQDQFVNFTMPIPATRGSIYDANLQLLAKDITYSKISVRPNSVKDAKKTSAYLAEKLDMDYDEVYELVSDEESLIHTIKSNVDNTIAFEMKDKMAEDRAKVKRGEMEVEELSGLEITDDKQRYFPNSTFAPYILGFTGKDHNGLYGIEEAYDDVLSGEDGEMAFLGDSSGLRLESYSSVKKEAIPGNNLITSIDSVIQHYAENEAYLAYLKNKPKRITIIVTDPNTGEIKGAAAYPNYDLANPWDIDKSFENSYSDELDDYELGEKQMEMWKNPFSSYMYEPGSTFKAITVASALDSGVVSMDSHYYCNGYLEVDGVDIHCDVYPRKHQGQSLTMAVSNSCNPAMMQVGMQLGPDLFYKYIYDFGFAQRTGVGLESEEVGTLSPNQDVNQVDFATLSFGQGLLVTPIQMIQALNTTINGGEYLKPQLVKYVTNADTGEIVHTYEKEVVRSVISEDTSEKIRAILKETVDNNMSLGKYRDIPLGGKTGTAQKYIGSSYAKGLYVSSFYGFAPYDNPEISVLVLVDEPSGHLRGGAAVASPIGAEVAKNCLDYLSTKQDISASNHKIVEVVPDLRGKDVREAITILSGLGMKFEVVGDRVGMITKHDHISEEYKDGTVIKLQVSDSSSSKVIMPDIIGCTVQNANRILSEMDINLKVIGGGICVKQSIKAGTEVKKNVVVEATFEYVQ